MKVLCARGYRAIQRALANRDGSLPICMPLEARTLLAVTPSEYDTIRNTYTDFALPANMAELNVIEVASNQLGVSSLKSAISSAANTLAPDLIVLRATSSENTIFYSSPSDVVVINSSVTIVGFGAGGVVYLAWSNAGRTTLEKASFK